MAKTLALLFLLLQKYHGIFNGPEWPQLYVSFERWILVIVYCLVNALLMPAWLGAENKSRMKRFIKQ